MALATPSSPQVKLSLANQAAALAAGAPTDPKELVVFSARIIAASRAIESRRDDRLFNDPFAERLAGPEAFEFRDARRRARAQAPDAPPADRRQADEDETRPRIAIRTRYFDDFAQQSAQALSSASGGGLVQVVLLGAGMDTRAWRLQWPENTTVYEVDQEAVLEYKEGKMRGEPLACRSYQAVTADLSQPSWSTALVSAGFSPANPSVWVLEGLLMYLSPEEVLALLNGVSRLAAPSSFLGASLVNEASWKRATAADPSSIMSQWRSGDDDPETLLERAGGPWEVLCVTSPGEADASYGRWTAPVPMRGAAGVGRVFYLTAVREEGEVQEVQSPVLHAFASWFKGIRSSFTTPFACICTSNHV
eukprot:tig00001001_g6214.t1